MGADGDYTNQQIYRALLARASAKLGTEADPFRLSLQAPPELGPLSRATERKNKQ
jgi:hypothetical protein